MKQLAPHAYYNKTKIPLEIVNLHIDVWEFSLEKATKIYPPDMQRVKKFDGTINEVDNNRTSRMIVAQVFYKTVMKKIE